VRLAIRSVNSAHLPVRPFGLQATVSRLEAIEREFPDFIVLDLGLPAVSGGDITSESTSRAQTRRIPIVMVQGQATILNNSM
jgi:CheY-like chemotaxis protein